MTLRYRQLASRPSPGSVSGHAWRSIAGGSEPTSCSRRFNVTAHPTAEWTARQIGEAFPWDSAPCYLLHDRDCIYGASFHQRVGEMGILEVLSAPRSPWQNAYAERLIGSLRREC